MVEFLLFFLLFFGPSALVLIVSAVFAILIWHNAYDRKAARIFGFFVYSVLLYLGSAILSLLAALIGGRYEIFQSTFFFILFLGS